METTERFFFPKRERLYLKNDIDNLFENGKSFISYPLRIVYLSDFTDNSSKSGISVFVSVPKKRFKYASKRNRIKRLIRESFRLNKNALTNLYKLNDKHLYIAFLYVCNEVLPYSDIEKATLKALKKIRTNNSPAENIIE